MSVLEKKIAITYKDGNNTVLALPYTKVENVDGAVSESDLASKNYITQEVANSSFLGKDEQAKSAVSATTAYTASKANSATMADYARYDSYGNEISKTYVSVDSIQNYIKDIRIDGAKLTIVRVSGTEESFYIPCSLG